MCLAHGKFSMELWTESENVSSKIKGAFNLWPVRRFYLSRPNHLPQYERGVFTEGTGRLCVYEAESKRTALLDEIYCYGR